MFRCFKRYLKNKDKNSYVSVFLIDLNLLVLKVTFLFPLDE